MPVQTRQEALVREINGLNDILRQLAERDLTDPSIARVSYYLNCVLVVFTMVNECSKLCLMDVVISSTDD